jgi:hypothetical protein
VKIRITNTPPGEAPEHVRQAWIGLEIPIAGNYLAPQSAVGFGVLTGSPQPHVGYVVDAHTAVELLAAQSTEAADWWRTNVPNLIPPGQHFMFDVECCEELPD